MTDKSSYVKYEKRFEVTPCHNCGTRMYLRIGVTSVGCHLCQVYAISTTTEGAVWLWNQFSTNPEDYGID